MRQRRAWFLALAASLLIHLGVFGGLRDGLKWIAALPEPSPPFEVHLAQRPPDSAPPPAAPALRRASTPSTAPRPARVPAATVSVAPPARPASVEPPASETVNAAAEPVAVEAAAPVSESAGTPAEVAPPALNPLPPRLDIQYAVRYGLASGHQSLLWLRDGERYTLTSVARAAGLAGVFYRGEFVQTSTGRITPLGLQPENFRDQRGDKTSHAQFDHAASQIHLQPAQGEPRAFSYTGSAQDALSLFFQLALTAPPPKQTSYAVFNGKKLRTYHYEVRGEVSLETALGTLRTLHLVRLGREDERFEAWLAIDRHYLPVQVVRSDDKGNEIELRVESITP